MFPHLFTNASAPVLLHGRVRLSRNPRLGILPRLLVLTGLFAAELLILSLWLDNASLASRTGLAGFIGHWGAWTVRACVGFAAIFFTFAYLKSRSTFVRISGQAGAAPIHRALLVAHLFAMAAFGATSWALYGNHGVSVPETLIAFVWLLAGCAGFVFAALALLPFPLWRQIVSETGFLSLYAVLAVVAACIAGVYSQTAWIPSGRFTFSLVKALLGLFVSGIIADSATMTLGTPAFSVQIAPQCSGFEGAGLMLAFGVTWLCLFRKESRFPHALLLLPAGVATIYLLNAFRITALILIGNAGAEQIAVGGFHSQAGWIAFNVVALGFSVAARRVPWFTTLNRHPREPSSTNPTATYLLPFLGILAAGMIATAASAGFEWLYPIRFVAAGGVLWFCRREYAKLDWKFTWFGPAIGVLVFALWIAVDALVNGASNDAMPQALAGASASARMMWIVFRTLVAVITVPIAEERVFRGFFIRRLISADFESLPLTTFTWLGLGVSSLAFGLLHGNLWFAGILAGVLYGWALLRRGRIGEAVIAHATTNALLAAYVLIFHHWHLW